MSAGGDAGPDHPGFEPAVKVVLRYPGGSTETGPMRRGPAQKLAIRYRAGGGRADVVGWWA